MNGGGPLLFILYIQSKYFIGQKIFTKKMFLLHLGVEILE